MADMGRADKTPSDNMAPLASQCLININSSLCLSGFLRFHFKDLASKIECCATSSLPFSPQKRPLSLEALSYHMDSSNSLLRDICIGKLESVMV